MAGAGFHHDARLMTLRTHGVEHAGFSVIQIHQDITGVMANRVRLKVHIITIAVACAQEFTIDSCPN
jgi:hypothetical protein